MKELLSIIGNMNKITTNILKLENYKNNSMEFVNENQTNIHKDNEMMKKEFGKLTNDKNTKLFERILLEKVRVRPSDDHKSTFDALENDNGFENKNSNSQNESLPTSNKNDELTNESLENKNINEKEQSDIFNDDDKEGSVKMINVI